MTVAYVLMVTIFGLITVGSCLYGEQAFGATAVTPLLSQVRAEPLLIVHLLVALITIILVAKAFGRLFAWFKQPSVMGEVVAGIALGPSLLGLISPELLGFLLPHEIRPVLSSLAQLGIILFMFLVGVELDTGLVKKRGHAAIAIAHASMLTPFLFGSIVAFWLYPLFALPTTRFTTFAVFMGVALSITALPVLARMISDLNIANSPMATLTLTCAAIGDVTAWWLLALAIGLAQANLIAVLITIFFTVLFYIVTVSFAPRLLKSIGENLEQARHEQWATTTLIVMILVVALCTELIGIHALIGPFLLGALVAKESVLAQRVTSKLEPLTATLLLPLFFAFTGMKTQIGLITTAEQWIWCLLLILIASVTKIGGATIAAKFSGIDWQDSLAIGVLMNTRGLMELIVLNIGLELNILSPTLFTMMVIMALVTTLITTPLFSFVTRSKAWAPQRAA